MNKLTLTLALMFAVGCAAQPCDVPPTDATPIVLGSDLPPEIVEAFERAAAEWNRAAPVHVQVVHGTPEESTVVMVSELENNWQAACIWCTQRIEVLRGVPASERFAIAAHELGHWLGWDNEAQTGVMSGKRPWGMRCIDETAAAPFGGKGTCE